MTKAIEISTWEDLLAIGVLIGKTVYFGHHESICFKATVDIPDGYSVNGNKPPIDHTPPTSPGRP